MAKGAVFELYRGHGPTRLQQTPTKFGVLKNGSGFGRCGSIWTFSKVFGYIFKPSFILEANKGPASRPLSNYQKINDLIKQQQQFKLSNF